MRFKQVEKIVGQKVVRVLIELVSYGFKKAVLMKQWEVKLATAQV